MADLVYAAPRCQFYERTAVEGGFRYSKISLNGPVGVNSFVTPYPPSVGDLITLWDVVDRRGGVFRVVARSWMHSSYGSMDWPYAAPTSKQGPMLDIVVEAAEALFVDEVPDEDDEE